MTATPEAFATRDALVEQAKEGLRACSEDLGRDTESFMRDDTDASWIVEHAKLLVPSDIGLVDFELTDDDWNELPARFDEMIRAAIGNKGKHRAPKVAAARGTPRPEIESAIAATYDANRAETEEQELVHALLWSTDEAARLRAADALETIYAAEATAHPYALHSLRAQKILRSK